MNSAQKHIQESSLNIGVLNKMKTRHVKIKQIIKFLTIIQLIQYFMHKYHQ